MSARRIGAIVRKELREYRHNRSLVWAMSIVPVIFCIQPLIVVFGLSPSDAGPLGQEHVLVYLLGIPALVPVFVAAYAVAGEREQATLEPVLTTPIGRDELLLGKALAALLPSVVVSYAVFALFLVLVLLLAQPGIAAALLHGPDLLAQVIFTPPLAAWSIWLGLGVSARVSDVRVAQQLAVLASLPSVFAVVVIALGVIPASVGLALAGGGLLVVLDVVGWWLVAAVFDRERLIIGGS